MNALIASLLGLGDLTEFAVLRDGWRATLCIRNSRLLLRCWPDHCRARWDGVPRIHGYGATPAAAISDLGEKSSRRHADIAPRALGLMQRATAAVEAGTATEQQRALAADIRAIREAMRAASEDEEERLTHQAYMRALQDGRPSDLALARCLEGAGLIGAP